MIYFTLKYTILFLFPFLVALLLSFIINKPVTYLESRLKFPRAFATFIIIFVFFVCISSTVLLIFTEIVQGTTYLADKIPSHFQTLSSHIEALLNNKIMPFFHKLTFFIKTLTETQQTTINNNIQEFTTQLSTSVTIILRNLLLKIPVFLSMVPYSITVSIFIIIATFLITNDWYMLKNLMEKAMPLSLKKSSRNIVSYLEKSLLGFLKAQFILIFISAFITVIGLLFLRVDHALTIALLIAIVDLLPLIGTGIIFIPWIGYLFLTSNYSLTISLTVLYMLIIILRQIIEPKILSANIGLNPLFALFTLFISIQLWGVTGIIIAPFLLVLASALYQAEVFGQLWKFIKG